MNGFEGQILVACGDFRQIPPVVAGGDKWDVVDASVRSSYLWRHFTICELTVAHRHAADPAYATFVQSLGEGILGEDLYDAPDDDQSRSEEHTSELQSLMRISYAVFCLKKKK